MTSVQVGAYQPLDTSDAPTTFEFKLPDATNVKVNGDEDKKIKVVVQKASGSIEFTFKCNTNIEVPTTLPQGAANEDRVDYQPAYDLISGNGNFELSPDNMWCGIYALFLKKPNVEAIPFNTPSSTVKNSDELREYLIQTGLGLPIKGISNSESLLLTRATFWQAAGIPGGKSWIHPDTLFPTRAFPYVKTFTRDTNVITSHPMRPPKPAPGSIVYSRYILSLNEHLTLVHIDPGNPEHFEAYTRWQNSDRVNVGWRERGPAEHHRKYLADRLADPHIFGVMVIWNGELAGYGEISWVKEDPMAPFVGDVGEFDQGTHYLCGEEKFRGRHRFTAVMTSLKHYCFLRDPRTQVVVGEPRTDLPIIPRLIAYLPQEFNREFELPHKRAVYFVLRRERFFQAGTFY